MTNEPITKPADALQTAMRAEHEGHHFYRMAAAATADPKGRETFERLAREELGHLTFLKNQYRSLMETGKADPGLDPGPKAEFIGANPIFSEELRARVDQAHFEMTALSVGIQLELNAIRYYTQASEEASDPVVKRFFGELAEWEKGHYNALLTQQETLKTEYWARNHFAPF